MGLPGTTVPNKVLVVEDDPAIARVLSRLLTRIGCAVVQAADGSEGVGVFDRETPDLVVLDLGLPSLDGWGVLRHIRGSGSVPVVIVTSDVQSHDRSLVEGANAFLSKPFDNNELVAQVGSLLVS
jgi:DNA-binding response OmpR family regulator